MIWVRLQRVYEALRANFGKIRMQTGQCHLQIVVIVTQTDASLGQSILFAELFG